MSPQDFFPCPFFNPMRLFDLRIWSLSKLCILVSVSNCEVLAGSGPWCSKDSGLVVVANRSHEGVEVLEVHTTVQAEVLVVLARFACPEWVLLRCHVHVPTTMSVWTEASLDLDCLPADACAVRWLSSDTPLNTFSRSLSAVNFLDGCTQRSGFQLVILPRASGVFLAHCVAGRLGQTNRFSLCSCLRMVHLVSSGSPVGSSASSSTVQGVVECHHSHEHEITGEFFCPLPGFSILCHVPFCLQFQWLESISRTGD